MLLVAANPCSRRPIPNARSASSCPMRRAEISTSPRASSRRAWLKRSASSRDRQSRRRRRDARADIGAKAAPDGYTLTLGSTGTLSTAPPLYPRLGYDPVKDFAMTSLVNNVPLVLEMHPSIPAKTMKEFIALAKSRPGKITMGSSGAGTTNHLSGELFQSATGTKFIHIPYKGSGPEMIDLMGGQIDIFFDQLSASIGYIQTGRLRALAVTTIKRASAMPTATSPNPAYRFRFEHVDRHHHAGGNAAGRRAQSSRRADQNAADENDARCVCAPGRRNAGEFTEETARFVKEDLAKWTRVVREAGIKLK